MVPVVVSHTPDRHILHLPQIFVIFMTPACGPTSQQSSRVSSLNDASKPADHLSTSVDPAGTGEHLLVKAGRSRFRGPDQL